MHRTLSLDYVVVMTGTVAVRTDGGAEKVVKEGDVIVVRGANHEYVNRGTDVARLFAVVVPSWEIEIGGEKLVKTEAGEVFDPPEED